MRKAAVAIAIIFILTVSGAFAASDAQNVDVVFDSVNISVNGKNVESSNILYNGTTYVPLRAIAQMLGKNVSWDSSSMTAKIDDEAAENPIATITMENGDVIKMELYKNEAPQTVANFIELSKKGFYNGITFHRIVPGFVVQGGDPNGNGSGGPGYSIKGEFAQNGVQNTIMHTRGTVSMARGSQPDSAGSQFFIVLDDAHWLNGEYAAFGRVIQGMDAVDKMAKVETDANGMPAKKQVMKSVVVEEK